MDKDDIGFLPDCLCTKCWAIFHKCCTSVKTPLFSSSWLYLDCLQVIPPCCLLPAAGDVMGMGTGSFSMFPAAQLKRAGKTWAEHLLLHSRVFSQRLWHQKQGKGCDAVMDFPSQGWFHLAAPGGTRQPSNPSWVAQPKFGLLLFWSWCQLLARASVVELLTCCQFPHTWKMAWAHLGSL